AYHGMLLILHRQIEGIFSGSSDRVKKAFIWSWLKIFLLFHAVVIGWLLFRAESLRQIAIIFSAFLGNFRFDPASHSLILKKLAFYILPLFAVQILQYRKNDLLAVLSLPMPVKALAYTVIFYLISIFGLYGTQNFIYMQ